ncbi:MAG: hypothetical protein BGO07_02195 [Alphaproteobacteria bacterium 40-19]|nr:MAG: hypothetical protein BGO07_02195 [Alphaproteobacteria bacterium 40-19]
MIKNQLLVNRIQLSRGFGIVVRQILSEKKETPDVAYKDQNLDQKFGIMLYNGFTMANKKKLLNDDLQYLISQIFIV